MSEFQIELKKGPLLIRIVGTTIQEISDAFDDALVFLEEAEKKLTNLERDSTIEGLKELDGIPTLKNPGSIREAVSQLMTSDWGKTPKTLGEILDAMETNAVFYPKSSVSSELSRMTRSGILRRIRTAQGFRYISGIKKKS